MGVKVDVLKNFPRPMQRQVWEGVEIREVSSIPNLTTMLQQWATWKQEERWWTEPE